MRRAHAGFSSEATEKFGHSIQFEIAAGIEERLENCRGLFLQAITRETRRDYRVVMRPDRTVVIRHRIVARFGCGDGANAPV